MISVDKPMRRCPRCSCGTEPDAVICGSCGAVLRSLAPVGDVIESVICACGVSNSASATDCGTCGAPLLQTCPRCDSAFSCTDHSCPGCGLHRPDFYVESCNGVRRKRAAHRRNAAVGQLPFLVFGSGVLLLAIWHQAHGATILRDVALIVGVISVGIWVVLRAIR